MPATTATSPPSNVSARDTMRHYRAGTPSCDTNAPFVDSAPVPAYGRVIIKLAAGKEAPSRRPYIGGVISHAGRCSHGERTRAGTRCSRTRVGGHHRGAHRASGSVGVAAVFP